MKPTLYDIRVDPILSNISVAYKNAEYVAEQILPIVKVMTVTGKYFVYDTSSFRKSNSLRGMGASAKEVDYGVSQSTAYVIKEHCLKELVPDELIEQAPTPLSPEMDATENVTEKLLVEKEYDLAAYMASSSNLTNYVALSGTDKWSDYSNSDPCKDIRTGKAAINAKIFREPNVLVLGKQVYDKLVDHPDIIDRIKYSALGVATTDLLARLFDVEKVIIGGAGYESATEGQTSSMAYIWGKNAWLIYVSPRPGIKQISFGYHFQNKIREVDKWYDKDRKGTFVRVTDCYTREIVSIDCAYLIYGAVA
ncbi:MAG: major capsid protein [Chloroflexi bacterium]|nr:major capsid protein [Chloroflexota bacterium]